MIVQCADCKTRYELDSSRVPSREIRVRCPKCRAVFGIDGQKAAEAGWNEATPQAPPREAAPPPQGLPVEPHTVGAAPAPAPEAQPVAAAPSAAGDLNIEGNDFAAARNGAAVEEAAPALEPEFEIERSAAPAIQANRPAAGVAGPAQPAPAADAATAVADAPSKPQADKGNEKAKRLARALVSDILVYHRDARDRALADGNLVQVLGQEIKKSWELYKERVTPEVANDTNYFREALNEILADGQQIF